MFKLNIRTNVLINNKDELRRLKKYAADLRSESITGSNSPAICLYNITDFSSCTKYSGCKKSVSIGGATKITNFPVVCTVTLEIEKYDCRGARYTSDPSIYLEPTRYFDQIHKAAGELEVDVSALARTLIGIADFESADEVSGPYEGSRISLYEGYERDLKICGHSASSYRETSVGQYKI